MVKKYSEWINESKVPYFNKADIVGDDNTYSINEVLDFLNLEDGKIVVIDPDSDDEDNYHLLQIMLKKIENYKPIRSINGDDYFDEYICYENFENSGKIVKAHHSDEQFVMFMMNDETYTELFKKFMGPITGRKYGL